MVTSCGLYFSPFLCYDRFRERPPGGGFQKENMLPITFVKEVIAELKKVTWPTREETIRYTAIVFAISILVGAFVGGLDVLFVRITSLLFKR